MKIYTRFGDKGQTRLFGGTVVDKDHLRIQVYGTLDELNSVIGLALSFEHDGLLENTWILLTSDHGEMFERGIWGHSVPLFYQPLIKIPMVVFPPGQEKRIDVYDKTSAEDVLPTLLHVTGLDVPSWTDGVVLPPFDRPTLKEARDISTVQVDEIVDGEIKAASAMLVRGNYKATWLFGYDEIEAGDEIIELYDLETDPEELNDLSVEKKDTADEMIGVLRSKMDELEQTYR